MGTFGQVLRELRNKRGISQNELSKCIGVSKSSVNMYERGEREPSFETLEAIADFFNVDMNYLLGGAAREKIFESKLLQLVAEVLRVPGDALDYAANKNDIIGVDNEWTAKLDDEWVNILARLRTLVEKNFPSFTPEADEDRRALLESFDKLNRDGQHRAVERVQELAYVPQYCKLVTESSKAASAPQES